MDAWKKYKQTEAFTKVRKKLYEEAYLMGKLRTVFLVGYEAGESDAEDQAAQDAAGASM